MPDGVLKIIVAAISTVIGLALIFLVGKLAGGGMQKESGRVILRYGWLVRGAALLCVLALVLCLFGYVVDLFTGWMGPPKGNVNPLLMFAGALAALGLPSLWEGWRRQLTLSDEGVTPRGWFGTGATIRWSDITKIENEPMLGKFFVRTAERKLGVSHYLSGLDVFAEECKKRLAPEVYGEAFGKK